jgi:zinc/manganese transport system permease protein
MPRSFTSYTWSWNLWRDLTLMWHFEFLRTALLAGLVIAVLCGTVGWFVVLRGETYAAHTLASAAFPGAAGAVLIGVAPLLGYGTLAVVAALLLSWLGAGVSSRALGSTATTGAVNALLLGLGYWFVTLSSAPLPSITSYLFGTFLGVTRGDLLGLLGVTAASLVVLAVVGRRLLFTVVDASVAEAAGVPVRLLSTVFLVLLALAVAQAAQFTGVLLVFALLVTPAATAQRLVRRPATGIVLAVLLAAAVTWFGLGAAFFTDQPVGCWITVLGFAAYVAVRSAQAGVELLRRRRARHSTFAAPAAA